MLGNHRQCRKSSHCLHHRLREISLQSLKQRITIQTGLPALTDGSPSTTWSSYGFGSPAFGGVVKEFGLAAKLESPTVVFKLTIQQTGGSIEDRKSVV